MGASMMSRSAGGASFVTPTVCRAAGLAERAERAAKGVTERMSSHAKSAKGAAARAPAPPSTPWSSHATSPAVWLRWSVAFHSGAHERSVCTVRGRISSKVQKRSTMASLSWWKTASRQLREVVRKRLYQLM